MPRASVPAPPAATNADAERTAASTASRAWPPTASTAVAVTAKRSPAPHGSPGGVTAQGAPAPGPAGGGAVGHEHGSACPEGDRDGLRPPDSPELVREACRVRLRAHP